MNDPLVSLQERLTYHFSTPEYLEASLTHRSYRFEREHVEIDNQRLEFLGDAALGLVSAGYLYDHFPERQEGELTKLRSRITNGSALARIGTKMYLGDFLLLGKGEQTSGGDRRHSNIADALEAVIGAAYIDGGLPAVEAIFHTHFVPYLAEIHQEEIVHNPKGALQEYVQKYLKTSPRYRLIDEQGPPHQKIFTVQVLVEGEILGEGTGNNKQTAEITAAGLALESLQDKDRDED